MSSLWEATTINGLSIKNRFVRSGTWDGMANTDGSCSPRMMTLMEQLAKNDLGLIVTGFAFVSREGEALPLQMGAYGDELLAGLTEMTESVHKAGGKIALQLHHGGLLAIAEITGQEQVGPSVMNTDKGPVGKAMTADQIQSAIAAFSDAAARAKKAGFDAVQIHFAHGYLLNQFLSSYFNHRKDEYGGSLENRARLALQVVQSVRDTVGKGYPILAKLQTEDFLPGGFFVDEMVQVAKMLERAGVDAIELSGGTTISLLAGHPNASPVRLENKIYYEEAAKRYKAEVKVPLMMVGGIRSLQDAERLVEQGITDYVSLARPLIREPNLVQRWKAGDTRDSACISDNLCLFEGLKGTGVRCMHLDE